MFLRVYISCSQVRVCHDDRDYYSYTEIPIECIKGTPSKDYNLVQAAFVGKPGSDLAADLGVTAQDDVLFAVFSESDSSEGDITSKPSKNSALCVYSLKSIRYCSAHFLFSLKCYLPLTFYFLIFLTVR